MEIALTGIDGSGKTTFLRKTIPYLKDRGLSAGHIDLPYFTEVPGFKKLSRGFICPLWEWAEKKNSRPVLVFLMVLGVMLYFPARIFLGRCDICLIEHHPRIDLEAYSQIYLGKIGLLAARVVKYVFPRPDMAVMLLLPPKKAYKRLVLRGKPLHPHENVEELACLEGLLRSSLETNHAKTCFVQDPEPEKFFNRCLL